MPTLVSIPCAHCGDKFESELYGEQRCAECKRVGHYGGRPEFCRLCQAREQAG
jgi:hypothetical protein